MEATENFSESCNVTSSTSTLSPSMVTKYIGGSESYFLISVIVGLGAPSPTPNSCVTHSLALQKDWIGSSLHLY